VLRRPVALWAAAAAGYAFLYVPLIIVVIYSFNNSRLNAEWVGFTLDWYDKLFHNQEMLSAAGNSLKEMKENHKPLKSPSKCTPKCGCGSLVPPGSGNPGRLLQ